MPLPNVSAALWNLTTPLELFVVSTEVVNFQADETLAPAKTFLAVCQPLPAQSLAIKNEGERDWKWLSIWTKENLQTDWIVQDLVGRKFRILKKSDWTNSQMAGHYEYEMAEQPIAGWNQ